MFGKEGVEVNWQKYQCACREVLNLVLGRESESSLLLRGRTIIFDSSTLPRMYLRSALLHTAHSRRSSSGGTYLPDSRICGESSMLRLLFAGRLRIEHRLEGTLMRDDLRRMALLLLVLLGTEIAWAQPKQQTVNLVINGHAGQAGVVQSDGRTYVDLEALARIANGSLSYKANRILLTLPMSSTNPPPVSPPAASPASKPVDDSGLSRDFMIAGIEEIALMREWASPLAYAIQNGYPVTEQWVASYRDQAAHGLSLASVAASTDADRSALQLLTHEFEAVRQWSNQLVQARNSMDTAKYAMSSNALRDDPLSQKIVTCGRFLASMLGSSNFKDDASCH
jgi:hypothetical protein